MSIGLRIKELRALHGWSQRILAEKTGINKALIANYELNRANPTVNGLIKLSLVFNISADYLLFGKMDGSTIGDKELFDLVKDADKFNIRNRQLAKELLFALSLKNKKELE